MVKTELGGRGTWRYVSDARRRKVNCQYDGSSTVGEKGKAVVEASVNKKLLIRYLGRKVGDSKVGDFLFF